MGHPKPTKVGIPGFVEHAKQVGQEILTAFVSVMELRKALSAFQNEPAGTSKPARDLSDEESFALLMHLVYQGEIMLDEKLRTDAAGRLVKPRPGQQLKIKARMAGVEFRNALNAELDYFLPKPVLAIALYRFATRLSGGYYSA
jgi:hypothetical protein